MNVLKKVDAGKPSAFVGMGASDQPIQINWLDDEDVNDEDDSWKQDETVVEVQKQGKKRAADDGF